MADSVRVEGLRDLRRALNSMEHGAARALNKALVEALEPVELVSSSYTPRLDGDLQASNKLATRGDRVILRNKQPYANTIHWGRKTLRGVPSVVKKRPWFTGALYHQRDQIGDTVIREIEIFVSRNVKS